MFSVVLALALGGLICWATKKYAPFANGWKIAIYVAVVICVTVFVLDQFGVHLHDVPVPQIR
jgi:hypothetical protein